jgi:hypothetical protein
MSALLKLKCPLLSELADRYGTVTRVTSIFRVSEE